jgi:N-succinyldiaminopimelate aminotransferase
LGLDRDYYDSFLADMRDKRDRLCAGLVAAGLDVAVPQGTYFVTTDVRSVGAEDGIEFCRALPHRCGVVAIPSAVFYDDKVAGAPLVRWACCKRPEVLDEAVARLKALSA